jgi:acyl carrier protein
LKTTQEITQALIELFQLEELHSDEVDADAPLFGEGLGLDSVDAIELTVYLDNEYEIRFPNMAEAQQVFASVRALTDYINAHGRSGDA